LSFEVYTPPVTYSKEVDETIRTPIEVKPLDETQLEDLGLNTCNHDLPLNSMEVYSFDEPEPQPQPLPNHPPLDAQLVVNEVVRVMIPKCMSWLDAYDEPIDAYDEPIGDMEDKVDNPSPQSTPQVLLSFEVYTPPVTYSKEVDETIRTPIEVKPLDKTQLEDLGLNTCNHDLPLNSMDVYSFDEPEPQPQPLPNRPPLD
nr:hypothetical protein [Tanacetum cinerariifolium]